MLKKVKILGGETDMISYEGLENALKKNGIGKTELSTELVRLLDMLEIPYDDNISG